MVRQKTKRTVALGRIIHYHCTAPEVDYHTASSRRCLVISTRRFLPAAIAARRRMRKRHHATSVAIIINERHLTAYGDNVTVGAVMIAKLLAGAFHVWGPERGV